MHPTNENGAMREKMNDITYDLIPFQELTDSFARVAEHGAKKYDSWNWSKGISRVQVLGSLLRHTFAYLRGKDIDDGPNGSGLSHVDHILWNAVVLTHNVHWGLEDGRRVEPDRPYHKPREAEQAKPPQGGESLPAGERKKPKSIIELFNRYDQEDLDIERKFQKYCQFRDDI